MFKKIKNYLSIIGLVLMLAKAFKKGLKKVLFKEDKDPAYLNQKDYTTCFDRAKAILMDALDKPLKMLSYGIGTHREKFHGEDHIKEKYNISLSLTANEIKRASRGWWQA